MMTLDDIQYIFNRAALYTFTKKKLLLTFIVLALCGLLVVFCRGLAVHAGKWVQLSLIFLPIFLCAGFLLSTGVLLIRIYHDEIKNKDSNYGEILSKSWELLIGATYFSIPMILCYLVLWMFLGVFLLLRQIPGLGEVVSVLLAFAPFLINLASILLCILTMAILFFVTPVIALKGLNRNLVSQVLMKRFNSDIFTNTILAVIATLPFLFFLVVLTGAALLTGTICPSCDDALQIILQWFFIMIPFTALLSPAVVFFFNFAAESHVFMQKRLKA